MNSSIYLDKTKYYEYLDKNNIWIDDLNNSFHCKFGVLNEENCFTLLIYLKELAESKNISLIKLHLFDEQKITGKKLGLFIEQNDIFEYLDLGSINISSPSFKMYYISDALVKSKNIKKLILSGNNLQDEFESLVKIIRENTSIEELHIGNNGIFEMNNTESFENLLPSFTQSLQINKTIKIFTMNLINPEVDMKNKNLIKATFNGLEINTSITEVDLSEDYLTDEDCKFFKVSNFLKNLDLSGNMITENGVATILDNLQNRTTKLTINLKRNEYNLEDLNLENKSHFITLILDKKDF
jgi:hypothetical protein